VGLHVPSLAMPLLLPLLLRWWWVSLWLRLRQHALLANPAQQHCLHTPLR